MLDNEVPHLGYPSTVAGESASNTEKPGSYVTIMVLAVVLAALPGTCPRQIFLMGTLAPGTTDSLHAVPGELSWVQLSRQSRYRRQMKNLTETLIPGTAGQLQASYWYVNYKVTSNSQSNACKMEPFVNNDLCRGRWIDSFTFIFKWLTRKKKSSLSTTKFDGLHPTL